MSNLISQTVSTIKNWWLFLISGVLFIAGAFYVLQTPKESYVALSWLFSILVLANGLSNVFFSIANRDYLKGWGWYLASGIFEILFGILLLKYPGVSMVILPLFVGFWLLFRGIQTISSSLELKGYGILDWGWIMLLGVAITIFATFMVLFPLFGFYNIIYLTFLALFLTGIANIMIALKLKKIKSKTIDKVTEFKKAIKSDLKELKKQVIKAYEEAPEADKQKIDAAFDAYEKGMN